MERLSCDCGCSKFDVDGGPKHWYLHELKCMGCGKVWGLPTIYVDGKARIPETAHPLDRGCK
jgi:hypothetical protein